MALSLEDTKPAFALMIGFFTIALIITFAISYWDAINHNFYILPEQKYCADIHTTNPICLEVYQKIGVPVGDNADLPNAYWHMLNNFVYIIAGAFGFVWLMFSIVLAQVRKTGLNIVNYYFSLVVGVTIATLPLTSWGDLFYFKILNMSLPATWDWLDHAGVFPSLLHYTGHVHVMTSDLYLAMLSGIAIITLFWIPIIYAFATAKKTKVIDLI